MANTTAPRTEIAFIDGRLQDIPSLLAGLPEGMEVHVLDPKADGFVQMAEWLAGRSEVGGIHVIGHGSSGNVTLGTAALNQDTLDWYSSTLGNIGQSLAATGDLLFYGCDVAAGENGQTLVEKIATLTGADVAASTNLTGAEVRGGNWVLETQFGKIDVKNLELFNYGSLLIFGSGTTFTRPSGATNTVQIGTAEYLGKGNQQISVVDSTPTPGVRFYLIKPTGGTEYQFITEASYTVTDNNAYDTDANNGLYGINYGIEINWGTVFNGVSGSTVTADFQYNGTTKTVTIDKGNTAPTVTNPTITANQGATVTGDLGADVDSNLASVTFGATSQYGALTAPTQTGATATYSFIANTTASLKGEKTETVSYTVKDSDNESATGTATIKVTYVDDAPTGSISAVTGTSKVGQALSQTNNISDVDDGGANVTKTYQWQAYDTTSNTWGAISGANAATFTPAADHANKLVRLQITAGSPVQTFTSTEVRLIAPETGAAEISFTNLPSPITVVRPSGDSIITSTNPAANATVTLDGTATGSTVTTKGNGAVVVANPANNVTVKNEGTGTTTVTGAASGATVTPQGTGPIVMETALATAITVDNTAPAGDLTLKNTGSGAVNVTPVGADGTVKVASTSTGPITLGNPEGSVTVTNAGSSTVTVNNLTASSTVTSNGAGTGAVTVASPTGDLTLANNTVTSTLAVTGVATGSTVTATGTGATAVTNPLGNVTVNNTGTGTSTVTGTLTGNTVTAKGTGAVVVNSVLSTPGAITVDATDNQSKVTVDNDGTGAITVTKLLAGATLTSTGSGTGNTTVENPTGSISVVNTGTNLVQVTGFDDAATLTTTGTGPTTVVSPDGSGTVHNTGSGLVTVSGVLNGKTFATTGTGPTTLSNPVGDLTVNNTGTGTVTASGLADGKTLTTNGSQPVAISSPLGNLTVANTGTGLDTITGLLDGKTVTTTGSGATTVSDPAGSLTLHNTGTGALTAAGVNTGATVTTTGTTATSISNPDGDVTVNNTGTGVATVTGTLTGKTVSTQGAGPIVVNSVLTTGNEITVAAGANTNLTLDNDSSGTITLTGVTTGSTVKSIGSGTGSTNINNPTGTGTLTVENTGTNPLTVTGLASGATLTNTSASTGAITLASPVSGSTTVHNQSSTSTVTVTGAPIGQVINGTGSGLTHVNDPLGNLTLHNTGTGELKASAVNDAAAVTTTGTTATSISNPDGNVTVNNTSTGVATVTGTLNGKTVTTQGTGPITVNSVLTDGNTVTVNAASNTNLTVDNDSTGAVNVTGVPNASTINSTGSGTGTTTVVNPTGNLTLNNTGSNTVTVTGFDTNKVLTTPGTGPVTVSTPDGNMFLTQSGTGVVTVTGIKSGNSITTSGSGAVSVSAPAGNVNVVNNGTGLVTVSGVTDGATVNSTGSGPQTIDLSGLTSPNSVTIDNDGTGLIVLTKVPYGVTVSFTGTGPTTVGSFSGDPAAGAVVFENLSTSLVTVANEASGVNGGTIKTSGSGPIKFDTDVSTGQTLTVNIADNANVMFDNDGAGILTVAGARDATTLTSSSSGPMTVSNPTGNLTVNNSANGSLNVTGFDTDKTLTLNVSGVTTVTSPDGNLTVNNAGNGSLNVTGLGADKTLTANIKTATTVTSPVGNLTLVNAGTGSMAVDGTAATGAILTTANSGNISVTNPGGNLTVANTGTGTVSVSGLNDNAILSATGTGNTTVTSPDADASFTVGNTGTGLLSVSGVANGKALTTQGTGQIAISSALGQGEGITVNTAANNNVQITHTGAGQVNVPNNLTLDNNDVMSLTLTGNNATVLNLTGTLNLANTPLNLNLANGYTPAVGHKITLISNDAADAITGTFAGKAEGATVLVGNYFFRISYKGIDGTGNDVVLTMTGAVSTDDGAAPAPAPAPAPVTDTDGVSSATENAVPSLPPAGGAATVTGDGNGDGVPDSQQSGVTSTPFLNTSTPVSNPGTAAPVYITLVADSKDGKIDTTDANTATLSNVQQLDAPSNLPANIKLPMGLLSFGSTVGMSGVPGIGVTETFSVYVDASVGATGYFKQNAAGAWVNLASAAHGGKVVTESGKTRLDFALTDGGEFDTDGTINGFIADPGGVGFSVVVPKDSDRDQFPDTLEAANGLTVGTKDNDVFGSSKFFAMQLYRDILYREGEAAGVQYWQERINAGMTRPEVAAAFLDSTEFQGGTGAIARLYFGVFNRLPDVDGMNYWMEQQQAGTSLQQIAAGFVASTEFAALYGGLNNLAFIQAQHQSVLGRPATAQEQETWSQQLTAGAGRGAVLLGLTESAEYRAASEVKLSVALNYLGLLGRPAEQAGFDYWLNQQTTGTPELTVVGNFIGSPEFHARFLD